MIGTLSDTGHAIWRIITAQAGAPIWTERELALALGQPRYKVRAAIDELFLAGLIRPVLHREGWRRA